MAFQSKRSDDGKLIKAFTKFGKNKEMTFTLYKGNTYLHISDTKNCFASGKFDFTKVKSVSFNGEEVQELMRLLPSYERYNTLFKGEEPILGVPSNEAQDQHKLGASSNEAQGEQLISLSGSGAEAITPPPQGLHTISPFRANQQQLFVVTPQHTPAAQEQTPAQDLSEIVDLTDDQILFAVPIDGGITQI